MDIAVKVALYKNAFIIIIIIIIIEKTLSFNNNPIIILAGDLNLLFTDFLEQDYGLIQLVHQPTHGNNILDKFCCSRPDIFQHLFLKV